MNLDKKLLDLRKWALSNKDGQAIKEGQTGDGDSLLWSGLLSFSGAWSQGQIINRCMDSEGRLWRSTTRVGKEEYNSFSRDMELGFLAHVAGYPSSCSINSSKNHNIHIRKHKKLAPLGDERVFLTPGLAGLINIVYRNYYNPKIGNFWRFFHGLIMFISAITAPKGFRLHLVAIHLMIRQQMKYGRLMNWIVSKIISAREPKNVFFMILADKDINSVLSNFYSQVPWEEPDNKTQWSQERTYSEHAYEDSMCWDFIFLILLMKKRYKLSSDM